jgi:hypothetical protein
MMPLDDPNEPQLTRAQERQRAFFCTLRQMLYLGRDGVETFTATSDEPISDQELYAPANNSTISDVRRAADRAVMLWECILRDARGAKT